MKPNHRKYESRMLANMIAMTLFAAIAMPICVLAQTNATQQQNAQHHHYKLVDMGTLGGPNSFSGWPFGLSINSGGTAIAEAETAFGDPYAPNCLQPECLVNHGLQWKNGLLTDMGALPGGSNSSFPFWINDLGDSVGMSNNNLYDPLTGYPEFRATLWKGGKVFDLGTLGGNVSFANAINNSGEVVGGALNSISDNDSTAFGWNPFPVATQFRAFLWRDGVMRGLGTLGSGNNAVALFLNDLGQVAGVALTNSSANSPTGNFTQDPFFWENEKMWDIGTLGGTSGVSYWLNNRGQVVGSSNVAGDQSFHAFLWDKEQGLKDLGTLPGGNFSAATWINDAGEIVGAADVSYGGHAVLWKSGATIDLGLLPGDCYSEALSINSRGQIIGNSSPDCVVDGNAVLWENGGAPVNLNTLVTPASDVNAAFPVNINDRGEIVAHGLLPNGDVHAVLLVPCDENHPNIMGCDYSLVDAVTTAQLSSAQIAQTPVPASAAKLSPAGVMARFRSMMARRNRRLSAGARP
jgi:probable HAF family extracellular repeat protein